MLVEACNCFKCGGHDGPFLHSLHGPPAPFPQLMNMVLRLDMDWGQAAATTQRTAIPPRCTLRKRAMAAAPLGD